MPNSTSIHACSVVVLLLACGGSPARSDTPASGEAALEGARPLEGPFATWEEVCGAPVERPEGATGDRYERCTVHITALDAGPFEAMATYVEGSGFDGDASLALKTAGGWFVQQIPDGDVLERGHHSPASAQFDPEATRAEGGVLRVVSRGSSSSFLPGQGPLGSSSSEWTRVQACGVRDGAVVCGEAEQVWSRSCEVGPDGERRCDETGADVR